MPPEIDVNKSINSKLSNDKISQLMAPIITSVSSGYVLISRSWEHSSLIPFIILFTLTILQAIFLVLPQTKNNKFFASGGPFPLGIYNAAIIIMFVFYLPIYSPLVIIIPILTFITVYYRGLRIMAFSIFVLILTVVLSYLRNGLPDAPYANYYPYILIILSISLTILVQRAGIIDNKIRQELIKASEKIAEEREQLDSLINGINESVIATDENGSIIFFNSSSIKLLSDSQLQTGEPFSKYVRLYDSRSDLVDFFRLIATNSTQQNFNNLHILNSNNEKIDISIDISRVKSIYNSREQQGLIFLIRDITKEKSLDQEREEFAAVTSHELRTPIATAEANISLAMDKRFIKDLSDESRERLEKAHQSIIYLADLINQLAELSNIEAPGKKATLEKVEVGKVFNQLYADIVETVTQKGLAINIEIPDGVVEIFTNRVYLMEILENFLSNGVKYTQKGTVILRAVYSQDKSKMIFSVEDTGDGISEADQERIFHKFYRAEDYKTMETRGTGLGLYLTLKLANYINGRIWFKSLLGKGSIFYLEVPVNQTNENPQPSVETSDKSEVVTEIKQ